MIKEEEKQRQELIAFISKYTGLLELQLDKIRRIMESTVNEVMDGVNEISKTVEAKKVQAEKVLEETYLKPDAETQDLVENVQKMVTEIFDEASQKLEKGQNVKDVSSKQSEQQIQTSLSNYSKKFIDQSKEIESLDSDLQFMLLNIMGALSSEDLIAQRMDHVMSALKGLQVSLGYILIDYDARSKRDRIAFITEDLKDFTFKQFTTEEEKKEFLDFFRETDKAS
jgi:hypothetical protein